MKTLEIGEQLDADQDDDYCEIDPAEFAKKVNLKASDDDVVIVAAKGQIKAKVKHFAKTLDGYVNSEADCLDTNGNLHECAAGDSMDNPYEIEHEISPHKMESDEAKPVLENLPDKNKTGVLNDGKCRHVDKDECRLEEVIPNMSQVKCEPFEEVIPDKSLVKCEPEDCCGFDEGVEKGAYDHLPELDGLNHELYTGGRVFDEEDDDDVVVVRREAL